jgi:hypothetical protein
VNFQGDRSRPSCWRAIRERRKTSGPTDKKAYSTSGQSEQQSPSAARCETPAPKQKPLLCSTAAGRNG